MAKAKFVPYRDFIELAPDEMRARAATFHDTIVRRRSIRQFARRPVDRAVIEDCIRALMPRRAARTCSHGILQSSATRQSKRRSAKAESEEREFYGGRAGTQWLKALEPIGTVPLKPFLEDAPYLIVVFQKNYAMSSNHQRLNHYYVPESVGIAVGVLISGLQQAGLATLIHTPRPMGFLRRILKRPANERACMIVVTGYPSPDATVPVLKKKPFDEIVSFF